MFRDVTQVPVYNAHSPFDGPPDGFAGAGVGTLLHRTLNCMKANYSFATQGGAIGTLNLLDDLGNKAILPPNAVIVRSFSNWTTAMNGGAGATIALGSGLATNDLKTATGFASYTGLLEGTPTGTAATMVALSTAAAGYQLSLTIAVNTLTAGIGSVYVWWIV